HNRFLHYCLQSDFVRRQIDAVAVSSWQQTISLKHLRALRIPVPAPSVIESIAHILGTLDDKIALNRRLNRTLAELACALFKSWFVEFDPVTAKAAARPPIGMSAATARLFPNS